MNVNLATAHLHVSFATANKLVEQLARLGLLEETTGGQRNRRYRYTPFLALFEEPPAPEPSIPVQTTESEK